MMRPNYLIFIINTLTIFVHAGWAQSGFLKGRVIDKETGEGLIAASLDWGQSGLIADINGDFEMELQEGNYELTSRYVGYQTVVQSIQITAGDTTVVEIAMTVSATLLNTATVSSGRYKKELSEVTVSLELLNPSLLESNNNTSIDQGLEKVPGVTVIDGQANIRGGSGFSYGAGSRVMLLVDDIPIMQPDAGFPNWDDVPVENLEQVEIVKGAASSLYGSSALNGVINVRTAYAKSTPETKASTFYTSYFSPSEESKKWWDKSPFILGASLSHKQKFKKLDLVSGGFYLKESSYNKSTYKDYGRINLNLRQRFSDRFSATLGANLNAGENGAFFYWQDDKQPYVGAATTLSERKNLRYNIDPALSYYTKHGVRHRLLGRYLSIKNEVNSGQSNKSKVYYAEYQYQKTFSALQLNLTAGLVSLNTFTDAELYGDTTFTSENYSAYLQLDKKFGDRLTFSGGMRLERNLLHNPGFTYGNNKKVPASDEDESKAVFRLGLNYKVTNFTYFRASWGQGYRYPTLAEKFIATNAGGISVVPNPTLKSETGWSAEVGIKQGFSMSGFNGYLDVAAFRTEYQDMMEFNLILLSFQSVNIGDTEIKGLDITLGGNGSLFGLQTSVLGGYTYIDPKFVEFDPSPSIPGKATQGQINANNSSLKENVLKYRSRHNFKIDLESKWKRISVGVASFYNSHVEAIDAAFQLIIKGITPYREANNNGYNIYNFRTGYSFNEHFKLSLILNNAFNKEVLIRPGLLDAPRHLTARLDWRL